MLEQRNTGLQPSRYSEVGLSKHSGATYTPARLAGFVASQMLSTWQVPPTGAIRVIDPAVGNGALLNALINELPPSTHGRLEVTGLDTNIEAIKVSTELLTEQWPSIKFDLKCGDFLGYALNRREQENSLFTSEPAEKYHLVIANPPYVRTQIMGAEQARQLSEHFGLTGRVDLYYPFLLGISYIIDDNGCAGVITSNRFMTTKSGQAVRRALLSRLRIVKAWDLGDTKLFDAAILPAVFVALGSPGHRTGHTEISFSSIYETKEVETTNAVDALSALQLSNDSVVAIPDGRRFHVRHGSLENGGDPEGVWRVSTQASDEWLATVESRTWATFRRIGKIRVGVKSTADKVFIRSDWDTIPGGRPELLRPLITRHCANRYKATTPLKATNIKEILYPHEVTAKGRSPVDLSSYPKAASYLELHRQTLEARTYVREAGRKWYELWVPQDPAAWCMPKLVFPDISDKPLFWIDTDGGIVNGDCYWLQCQNADEEDLLWLALGIANSTFIESFYDRRFNNKLYSGRRRFITQYVEQFPLPDPGLEDARKIISITKRLHAIEPSAAGELVSELDRRVWEIFGLQVEKVAG